jgi:hypothetical protein
MYKELWLAKFLEFGSFKHKKRDQQTTLKRILHGPKGEVFMCSTQQKMLILIMFSLPFLLGLSETSLVCKLSYGNM